ncbi:unnamed protein product [Caenorhabditis nigoni]
MLKDKMVGISEEQKSKRRKKWRSMYVQSVIQDFIQLIYTANYNFTSILVDAEWDKQNEEQYAYYELVVFEGSARKLQNYLWSFTDGVINSVESTLIM